MDNINEKILIEHLSNPQTKHKAFETIVKMYSEQLYWNVRRIVTTHEDANDVVQNVFIKAWNSLDSFRNESKIYTWLYRISVNESLDFMRKQKTQHQLYTDNSPVADTLLADKYFDGSRAEALLQAAIAQLPDVQRLEFLPSWPSRALNPMTSSIAPNSNFSKGSSLHLSDPLHSRPWQWAHCYGELIRLAATQKPKS